MDSLIIKLNRKDIKNKQRRNYKEIAIWGVNTERQPFLIKAVLIDKK